MMRPSLYSTLILFAFSLSAWGDDPEDDDGDGYGETAGDCDDTDASVYPGAEEICDGIDNDCNGQTDEGTECGDDDGDGFSEVEGDCDDSDMSIHPLVVETIDGVDQDCDGLIDEETSVFDDDGDGYSEEDGDCDDSDTSLSPGEPDWCRDGIDNDCDGVIDDPCVEDPADGCDPELGVDLWTSAFSARPGTDVRVMAEIRTEDVELDPTTSWTVSGGAVDPFELEANWTLPEEEGLYQVSVFLMDGCGTEATDTRDVSVIKSEEQITEAEVNPEGCGAGQAWIVCLIPGLLGFSRRLTPWGRTR